MTCTLCHRSPATVFGYLEELLEESSGQGALLSRLPGAVQRRAVLCVHAVLRGLIISIITIIKLLVHPVKGMS